VGEFPVPRLIPQVSPHAHRVRFAHTDRGARHCREALRPAHAAVPNHAPPQFYMLFLINNDEAYPRPSGSLRPSRSGQDPLPCSSVPTGTVPDQITGWGSQWAPITGGRGHSGDDLQPSCSLEWHMSWNSRRTARSPFAEGTRTVLRRCSGWHRDATVPHRDVEKHNHPD
jgi:hypothetical protein